MANGGQLHRLKQIAKTMSTTIASGKTLAAMCGKESFTAHLITARIKTMLPALHHGQAHERKVVQAKQDIWDASVKQVGARGGIRITAFDQHTKPHNREFRHLVGTHTVGLINRIWDKTGVYVLGCSSELISLEADDVPVRWLLLSIRRRCKWRSRLLAPAQAWLA